MFQGLLDRVQGEVGRETGRGGLRVRRKTEKDVAHSEDEAQDPSFV